VRLTQEYFHVSVVSFIDFVVVNQIGLVLHRILENKLQIGGLNVFLLLDFGLQVEFDVGAQCVAQQNFVGQLIVQICFEVSFWDFTNTEQLISLNYFWILILYLDQQVYQLFEFVSFTCCCSVVFQYVCNSHSVFVVDETVNNGNVFNVISNFCIIELLVNQNSGDTWFVIGVVFEGLVIAKIEEWVIKHIFSGQIELGIEVYFLHEWIGGICAENPVNLRPLY